MRLIHFASLLVVLLLIMPEPDAMAQRGGRGGRGGGGGMQRGVVEVACNAVVAVACNAVVVEVACNAGTVSAGAATCSAEVLVGTAAVLAVAFRQVEGRVVWSGAARASVPTVTKVDRQREGPQVDAVRDRAPVLAAQADRTAELAADRGQARAAQADRTVELASDRGQAREAQADRPVELASDRGQAREAQADRPVELASDRGQVRAAWGDRPAELASSRGPARRRRWTGQRNWGPAGSGCRHRRSARALWRRQTLRHRLPVIGGASRTGRGLPRRRRRLSRLHSRDVWQLSKRLDANESGRGLTIHPSRL